MRSADFLNMKGPYRPRLLVYSQQIRSFVPNSPPAELDWALPFCCPWFSSANKFNGFSYCNNLELLSSGLRLAARHNRQVAFGTRLMGLQLSVFEMLESQISEADPK